MQALSCSHICVIPLKTFKNMAMAIVSLLPDSKNGNYLADRCKRFIKASVQTAPRAYYSLISGLSDEKKERVFSKPIKRICCRTAHFYYSSASLTVQIKAIP